jgi:hypothetical protein
MNAKASVVAIFLAVGCAGHVYAQSATSGGASPQSGQAQSQSSQDSDRQRIKQERKAALEKCKGMKGNEKHICMAEADGQKDVAEAQLKVSQRDTPKNRYEFEKTKADAQYRVAKARCGDEVREAQETCESRAKADRDKARAQAKQQSESRSAAGQ